MSTAIATWGNSEAVRIPREILKNAGLRKGDRINFALNPSGNIELIPEKKMHRRVAPAKNISFETLFAGYENASLPESAWPNDDLIGAEWDAWSH